MLDFKCWNSFLKKKSILNIFDTYCEKINTYKNIIESEYIKYIRLVLHSIYENFCIDYKPTQLIYVPYYAHFVLNNILVRYRQTWSPYS